MTVYRRFGRREQLMGRDFIAEGLRFGGAEHSHPVQVAETLARILVSFLLLPRSVVALDGESAARVYVRDYVAPIIAYPGGEGLTGGRAHRQRHGSAEMDGSRSSRLRDQRRGRRALGLTSKTERAGFEPAMEFNPHTRLAGECLQPLGHLSRGRRQV
jgi:hypothetical protein